MTTFFFTLGLIAVLMAAMAVGVVFTNRPLRGSCGGVGTSCACEEAGTPGACKPGAVSAEELYRAIRGVGSEGTSSLADQARNAAVVPYTPSVGPLKPPGAIVQLRRG